MNEAADGKDIKEQSSSRMQIPLADLRSWCAVWASRKQQHELRLNLQRLIEQIDSADDGFPERPDEFDYEEPDDGTEGYFYLTVCFTHPGEFRFFGVGPDIAEGFLSHSLAWSSNGLYVMANAWWEPLEFEVQEPGEWRVVLATAVATSSGTGAVRYTLAPRSIVVLQRIGA